MIDFNVERDSNGTPLYWMDIDIGRNIAYVPRRLNFQGNLINMPSRTGEIVDCGYSVNSIEIEPHSKEDRRLSDRYEVFLFRGHEKPHRDDLSRAGEWCFID
jgi:hypothetical protein